jgi:hypothetical protein
MSIDDDIKAAWAAYENPKWPQILTAVTPDFERGYRDGRASVTDEVAAVLAIFDSFILIASDSDDCRFQAARDRLRALL